MDVTAEGIETIEQTSLRNFGCDFGQGYYFARPLTKADMNALLHDRQPFEMHDSTRIAVVQPITAPAALAAG
jgi:sensor c-di-GMP phosphodiesterase-like protein